ncbi:MAG: alpha/beta fold hydrolase, partial [Gammaproteobacteria bacterium]
IINMVKLFRNLITERIKNTLTVIPVAIICVALLGCSSTQLKPWHTEKLTEEFKEHKADEVQSFDDYLQLEERLFKQLDEKVYAKTETGPEHKLDRYSSGSAADPRKQQPNWNRSFELSVEKPRGGVLLIHGMSDSPYSLRTLGKALNQHGYWVIGMRMPGHGTAPSGLRYISRHDMAAAVRIGMTHLDERVNGKPVHMIGYSTGAPLALEFALDALDGKSAPVPGSLILISPAIGIHPAAGFASFKDWLSNIPGLDDLAYTQVQPEFDPYKYNSFATNAADVVHGLTRSVANRVEQRAGSNPDVVLPPVLVLKSTVDATVTTDAVVDNLLEHLNPNRHELVLFDINRYAASYRVLIDDPAPLTDRVMGDDKLPFTVTLVTNQSPDSTRVISKYKDPFSADASHTRELGLSWPAGVISLSHVALPIAPDDPTYGQRPPNSEEFLYLGQMAIQGERGLLTIPSDWMFRLRYNPFYDYLENRLLEWVENTNKMAR